MIFNSCISCPKIVNLIENWGEKVDENWGDSLLLCDVITARDGTCHSVLQTGVDLGPNNNVYRFIENHHGQKSILFYEEGKLHPSEF